MCLIMHMTNKESVITQAEFEANLKKNQDGTGVMFAQDGKVVVRKALGKPEAQVSLFMKTMKHFRKGRFKEVIVHSRLGTHGTKDELNCHPYQILNKEEHGRDLWCMHNGVINVTRADLSKSDTWHFLNNYIKPTIINNHELLNNENFIEMISKFIGSNNKLVFLDGEGNTYYVNKCSGTDYNGIWISNEYSGIIKKHIAPVKIYPANDYKSNNYSGQYGNYDEYEDYYPRKDNTILLEKIKIDNSPTKTDSCIIPLNKTTDKLAIDHCIKILIVSALRMSENELYSFVAKEPIIATELLLELLSNTKVEIGRM